MLRQISYQRWNFCNEREWGTGKFQLSADPNGSSRLYRCLHVACKDVHKGGFARSRRPKDCCQLPGSEFAADCLKNCVLACNKQDHNKTLQYCLEKPEWSRKQVQLGAQFCLTYLFISLLYIFRASMCPSSGENCCIYATVVFVTLYGWRHATHTEW